MIGLSCIAGGFGPVLVIVDVLAMRGSLTPGERQVVFPMFYCPIYRYNRFKLHGQYIRQKLCMQAYTQIYYFTNYPHADRNFYTPCYHGT